MIKEKKLVVKERWIAHLMKEEWKKERMKNLAV